MTVESDINLVEDFPECGNCPLQARVVELTKQMLVELGATIIKNRNFISCNDLEITYYADPKAPKLHIHYLGALAQYNNAKVHGKFELRSVAEGKCPHFQIEEKHQ
jgi:hypothetical protein